MVGAAVAARQVPNNGRGGGGVGGGVGPQPLTTMRWPLRGVLLPGGGGGGLSTAGGPLGGFVADATRATLPRVFGGRQPFHGGAHASLRAAADARRAVAEPMREADRALVRSARRFARGARRVRRRRLWTTLR